MHWGPRVGTRRGDGVVMTVSESARNEWRTTFAEALAPLSDSVTAHRRGLPDLGNVEYRALARRAARDVVLQELLSQYLTEIAGDPEAVIGLVLKHPAAGDVFGGRGQDAATFVTMPGKGFRVELKQFVRRAAALGARLGVRAATDEVDQLLTLGAEGQLPGYEVVVIRGLSMKGVTDLGPGTRLASYDEALARGLLKAEPSGPANDDPDYRGMQALVMFREMTWSPCLVVPGTSKDLGGPLPTVRFAWHSGPALSVLLDLLSLATSQRIDVVEMLSCAPAFTALNPSFGPGSKTGFQVSEWWKVKAFEPATAADVRRLYEEWGAVIGTDRDRLELSLGRLVSSERRNLGRFRYEDRLLDIAVALEVLFGLQGGELTHKLSVRAAHLLGDSGEERLAVYESVQRLYKERSRIVHGSRPRLRRGGKQTDTEDTVEDAYQLGRTALLKILARGSFPDWTRLTLAAE